MKAFIEKVFKMKKQKQKEILEKGKAYYWRVKATDSKNAGSKYSATYSFYTEGVALSNYVPFSPQLVRPVLNSTITSTTATLEWTASDADATKGFICLRNY